MFRASKTKTVSEIGDFSGVHFVIHRFQSWAPCLRDLFKNSVKDQGFGGWRTVLIRIFRDRGGKRRASVALFVCVPVTRKLPSSSLKKVGCIQCEHR